jgi:hypothetical protein
MRLLNINTEGGFSLTRFVGNNIPSYAILSHTWEEDNQEVTFQDLVNGIERSKAGYRKIQFCGEQAKKDSLQYFWVDSCYIIQSHPRRQCPLEKGGMRRRKHGDTYVTWLSIAKLS